MNDSKVALDGGQRMHWMENSQDVLDGGFTGCTGWRIHMMHWMEDSQDALDG